jgi:predicted DNA-binding protein
MPDKRKRGKKQVAVWLTPQEKEALARLAKRRGMTMSDILKECITNDQENK